MEKLKSLLEKLIEKLKSLMENWTKPVKPDTPPLFIQRLKTNFQVPKVSNVIIITERDDKILSKPIIIVFLLRSIDSG